MPLDEVWLEVVDPPEELHRPVDKASEERDPEAEVRRGHGRCPVPDERAGDEIAVRGPGRRRDHEPAAAGIQGARDVRRDGVRSRGFDDDIGVEQCCGVMAPGAGPAHDENVVTAIAGGIGNRYAERTVAKDRDLHLPAPSLLGCCEGPPERRFQTNEKPRSPSWCRGPWSLRSLEAPVRRWTRR